MKTLTLKTLLAICCIAFVNTGTLSAQVPAHGSLVGTNAEIYTQTLPLPADPASELTSATLNYKAVTMNGTTWVWMELSAGSFWGDVASEFGYTTDEGTTASKFPIPAANIIAGSNNRQIIGSTTTAIPTGAKLFCRPQANLTTAEGINGGHHTTPVTYDPDAYNSGSGDAQVPTFPAGGPTKIVDVTSITITLNATDNSGNLFYYIVDKNSNAEVVFTETVTYTFQATDADQTYTIYAVDFSGNASAAQTVKTISETATKLPTPTGLSLGSDKKTLTFTNVANASSYLVLVMDSNSEIVFEQAGFNSGDELNYLLAGDLTINLRANGDGVNYSNSDLAQIAWGVIASDINLVTDEQYCNFLFNPTGNNGIAGDQDAAYLTWGMNGNNIEITITPYFLVNEVNQTEFRGTGINTPANITVNGDANTGNKYFAVATQSNGGLANKVILTPQRTIPVGSQICYANGYIVYKTVVNAATNTELGYGGALHDLYPNTPYTASNPYIYGSACPTSPTSVSQVKTSEVSLASTYVNDVLVISGLAGNEEVKIVNALGALVKVQNTNGEVNVSDLPVGMYLLLVKGQSFKFIKK